MCCDYDNTIELTHEVRLMRVSAAGRWMMHTAGDDYDDVLLTTNDNNNDEDEMTHQWQR